MANFQRIAAMASVILLICNGGRSTPDTTWVSSVCNGDNFGLLSYHVDAASAVVGCLIDETANAGYDHYCRGYGGPGWNPQKVPCYGHAACNGEIGKSDCTACLNEAALWISRNCEYSMGVQVQLQDCRMRYEAYPFTE